MARILKTNEFAPDGVPIRIEVEKMRIGESIFIPCINTVKLIDDMKVHYRGTGIKYRTRKIIEKDLYGIRLWRIM